jgi:hypothetical protein
MIEENEAVIIYPAGTPQFWARDAAMYGVTPDPEPVEGEEPPVSQVPIFEGRTDKFYGKNDTIMLDYIKEWKASVGVDLVTVPKLNGPGSYVESRHITEKEMGFSCSIMADTGRDAEKVADKILTAMLDGTKVTVFRVMLKERSDTFGTYVEKVEQLDGEITGLSDWTPVANHAYMTFSVKFPDPQKKWATYDENQQLVAEGVTL